MSSLLFSRRILTGSALALGTTGLSGCDALVQNDSVNSVLAMAEQLTMSSQRLLVPQDKLAREFAEANISPTFRSNGTRQPDGDNYAQMTATGFANWRLKIDGLVDRPMAFSLADLNQQRQGRFLGGPRLRMVRRNLAN